MRMVKWPLRLMLDLSTAHLMPETREWMGAYSCAQTESGFLIHSGTGGDADTDPDHDTPADLAACRAYARSQGADYLLFDRDAEMIDGLPAYDFDTGALLPRRRGRQRRPLQTRT